MCFMCLLWLTFACKSCFDPVNPVQRLLQLLRAHMKTSFLVAILLLAFSLVMAQDTSEIRNFLRINKDFCTGGQPKLEHLEKLKADGVKTIINLRQPSEHRAAEEEAKAKDVGLKYFNIPVAYGNPNEEQVAE